MSGILMVEIHLRSGKLGQSVNFHLIAGRFTNDYNIDGSTHLCERPRNRERPISK